MRVPFVDLDAVHAPLEADLVAAAKRVVTSSWYILGEELAKFEQAFAAYCGVGHCIGVGNGMDAITLALRACGIGPGDEVVTVSHTFFATAAAITATGATPVFVDVDPATACLDPDRAAAAVTNRTRAIVPVHLYGRCANMTPLLALAESHRLFIIEDAAQAHGAVVDGRRAGASGHAGCFSFYPTKNLGALGDGGAVTTDDPDIARRVSELRNYGQERKYVHREAGVNSRLDEVQAALLSVKLPYLDAWNAARARHAERYRELLAEAAVELLAPAAPGQHVHHLMPVLAYDRDALQAELAACGIDAQIHYPIPIHLQAPYRGAVRARLEATEHLAKSVLTLPMHPALRPDEVEYVSEAVCSLARPAPG